MFNFKLEFSFRSCNLYQLTRVIAKLKGESAKQSDCKRMAIGQHVMADFVKFRTGQKAEQVIEEFREMKGFPGVHGAIDGSHIPINK